MELRSGLKDQLMLLDSTNRELGHTVYRRGWWGIISHTSLAGVTWSCVQLGPQSQRGSNDISVCCSSEATRIPRGWMGQFRSRSEDKLIRELWESVSIKREPGFNCPCHGFLWTRVDAVSNIADVFMCFSPRGAGTSPFSRSAVSYLNARLCAQ